MGELDRCHTTSEALVKLTSRGSDRPVDQLRYVIERTRPPCLAYRHSRASSISPMATLNVIVGSKVGEQFGVDMRALMCDA